VRPRGQGKGRRGDSARARWAGVEQRQASAPGWDGCGREGRGACKRVFQARGGEGGGAKEGGAGLGCGQGAAPVARARCARGRGAPASSGAQSGSGAISEGQGRGVRAGSRAARCECFMPVSWRWGKLPRKERAQLGEAKPSAFLCASKGVALHQRRSAGPHGGRGRTLWVGIARSEGRVQARGPMGAHSAPAHQGLRPGGGPRGASARWRIR
jgi:hypothetical protein